jgi:hypothetical protein
MDFINKFICSFTGENKIEKEKEKLKLLITKWTEIQLIQEFLAGYFGKTFAIDGRMRGDFGECLAEILFDGLTRANEVGVDFKTKNGTGVQVKFYGIDSIPLEYIKAKNNKIPDKEKTHLLIFHLPNNLKGVDNCLSKVELIWNDLVANLPEKTTMSAEKLKDIKSQNSLSYDENLWNYLKDRKKIDN